MALRIVEFFGYAPLEAAAKGYVTARECPFIQAKCIKPNHGACSVQQLRDPDPVISCPNRLYAEDYKVLGDIAVQTFGAGSQLTHPDVVKKDIAAGQWTDKQVAVFGRRWGRELPLPRPPGSKGGKGSSYYVDWILAKTDQKGTVQEIIAVEVQTIDSTGKYKNQADAFFKGFDFTDLKGRKPGYSNAGMNWENVSKRILPQVIYKGHVLRREGKCKKGLFFVAPKQVYERIRERLGGKMHEYVPGNGTITFCSYELGPPVVGNARPLVRSGQFTTTIDQVALAFTAPMNLPPPDVYEKGILKALS